MFQFGDKVRSAAACLKRNALHNPGAISKDEFEGVVTFRFLPGNGPACYHVRDEHGEYWHREERELTLIQ